MRYLARPFGALLLGAAIACSNSTDADSSPTPGVVGTYSAASFVTTEGGLSIDRIAAGLVMIVRLRDDGTTTGTIAGNGATVPVAGTWDTTGTELHFHDSHATFLEQLPFHIQARSLTADDVSGATRYRIVLNKVRSGN